MGKNYKTPIKAIRAWCYDCSGFSYKEVRLCANIKCPLYAYRMGTRPDDETLDTLKSFYEENPEKA